MKISDENQHFTWTAFGGRSHGYTFGFCYTRISVSDESVLSADHNRERVQGRSGRKEEAKQYH